jgi:hypothetical protein
MERGHEQPVTGPAGMLAERVGDHVAAAELLIRQCHEAVDRSLQVKQRELAAHLVAVALHEGAAKLQERLGHPDRAAEAHAHAEQARALHRLAAEGLADYQAQIAAVKDKAGRPPSRSA